MSNPRPASPGTWPSSLASWPILNKKAGRTVKRFSLLAALVVPPALLAAGPAAWRRAGNSITPQDVQRRIGVVADDSMLGRATPSPQLEEVAAYVAAEFKRFGLKPGGENGTFFQRYSITQSQIDTAKSRVTFSGRTAGTLTPGTDVYVLRVAPLPKKALAGPVLLFAGTPDSANPLAGADVKGAWGAEVVTATPEGVNVNFGWIQGALRAGAVGALLISNRPDAQWQNRLARAFQLSAEFAGDAVPDSVPLPGVIEIRDAQAAALLGVD